MFEADGGSRPQERYGEATQGNVVRFLAFEPEYPNSIYSCIVAARENARSVRETISSEMWEQINGMYLLVTAQNRKGLPEVLPEFCLQIRMACHLFQGITQDTMSHDEAWHFIQLGRRLERADKTSRTLDVKYFILLPSVIDVGTPYDDVQWTALLKSVTGFEMYRKKHGRIAPRNIVDFLVLDREFPRTIRHCLREAHESLHAITGTPMGSCVYPSERSLAPLRAELDYTSVDRIISQGLHEYLDALQVRMNTIDDNLALDFFAREPVTQSATAGGNS